MENKPKKSKAIIITIILIIVLLLAGYFIFQKDVLNIKNSTGIAKIFSPLIASNNSKNLTTIQAQAGEDIKKGDNVSVFGTGTNNNPIVVKTSTNNGPVLGYANQDITSGNTGDIVTTPNNGSNGFWNSISNFLGIVNNPKICSNGSTNYPDCNNVNNNSVCPNGATNYPACTITPDNTCVNKATNPPECNTFINVCPSGWTGTYPNCVGPVNPNGFCPAGWTGTYPNCTIEITTNGLPDLTASRVTPTSTLINTPTTLSSIVTNIGTGNTGSDFHGFFSIMNSTGTTKTEIGVTIPSLPTMVGSVAKISYTFHSSENYSIRFCADKKNSSDTPPGEIVESNEDNNCSDTIILAVTNSIPDITNACTNGATDYPTCTPPNTGCLSTEVLDTTATPNICIPKEDCTSPRVINGGTCENPNVTPETNSCLLIAQNPLTFTDAEKAQLAELLRKFYVISSTLKSEDDIALIYKEEDSYQTMIASIEDLTQQCYTQTLSKDGTTLGTVYDSDGVTPMGKYTGPTTRGGNPWYSYDTRPSYVPDSAVAGQKINYCTGQFNQKMKEQGQSSCAQFITKSSCEYWNYSSASSPKLMMTGCSWIGGTDLRDYEKILNIW